MKPTIIIADNQVIFRTGMARVLGRDNRFGPITQCGLAEELKLALDEFPESVVVYPSSFEKDLTLLAQTVRKSNGRSILVLEHGVFLSDALVKLMHGCVMRSVSPADFIHCLQNVIAGKRSMHHVSPSPVVVHDFVGANLLERLTRKELQIIALVSEGWKNREIADKLGTKEQVIKNYLCNIYDKTGVSDRLELALYTVHHSVLAQAAQNMRVSMMVEAAI